MSYPGQQVIAHIDTLERERELKIERNWWKQYADCLTPAERKRLAHGNYAALKRPTKPDFTAGAWIEVRPKLHVRVERVVLNRGKWQVWIDAVRDFRTQTMHMRRFSEDAENVTTLDLRINDGMVYTPEPERIPPEQVAKLPSTVVAKMRYAEVQQEVGGQRLAEQQMKHLSRRLRRLQLDGIKYGVDLSPALIGMLREAEREVGEARRAAA